MANTKRQLPTAVWVAAVLFVGVALRLYVITDDPSPDSFIYAQHAHHLLKGTFTLRDDSWYVHRLPVFAPVAAAYAALGVNVWTTHAWPLLCSMLELILTMWLGFRLTGRSVGLVAGALLALLPLSASQAGRLLPDGVMATLLTVAAVTWIGGRERADGRSRLLMVLSGVCLALAMVIRVYAVLLVVLYIGDILRRPRTARDLLWPALGGLAVVLPLAAVYRAATGDALYPLRVVSSAYGQQLAPQAVSQLLFYPSILWHPRTEFALHAWLFAGAIVFALVRRERGHVLLLLWTLPLLLFLEFGTMSFSAYVPVFKERRFLTVLAAPLSLLAASMLCALVPWSRERLRRAPNPRLWRAAAVAVGAVLLLAGVADSLFVLRRDRVLYGWQSRQTRAVVALLSAEPDLPILVDHWRTASRLAYFFDFREGADLYVGADDRLRMRRDVDADRGRFQYLCWYRESGRLPAGLVVLEDSVLADASRADSTSTGPFFVGEIPAYAYHPPASWRLVRRLGTWRIYRTPPAGGALPQSLVAR
jgi:4-amino-4-deoxy-L-arabinose transferase-like glycosyltransferase